MTPANILGCLPSGKDDGIMFASCDGCWASKWHATPCCPLCWWALQLMLHGQSALPNGCYPQCAFTTSSGKIGIFKAPLMAKIDEKRFTSVNSVGPATHRTPRNTDPCLPLPMKSVSAPKIHDGGHRFFDSGSSYHHSNPAKAWHGVSRDINRQQCHRTPPHIHTQAPCTAIVGRRKV